MNFKRCKDCKNEYLERFSVCPFCNQLSDWGNHSDLQIRGYVLIEHVKETLKHG